MHVITKSCSRLSSVWGEEGNLWGRHFKAEPTGFSNQLIMKNWEKEEARMLRDSGLGDWVYSNAMS